MGRGRIRLEELGLSAEQQAAVDRQLAGGYSHDYSLGVVDRDLKPANILPPRAPRERKPRGMNRWEQAYAQELDARKAAGDVVWWAFEGIRLRLAEGAYYTPDFPLLRASGALELHEVKGHWRKEARVRIKVAADRYPFRFVAVRKKRKRDGGGWSVEEIPGRGT